MGLICRRKNFKMCTTPSRFNPTITIKLAYIAPKDVSNHHV